MDESNQISKMENSDPANYDCLDEETFGCDRSDNGESSDSGDFHCDLCKSQLNSPRVLACLHVFCLECLQKLVDAPDSNDQITCPSCSHRTKMNGKPASSLLVAYVNGNMLDMEAVRAMTVVCTSCKSGQRAVSRCADCANFLCLSCDQAHQVMRCFENHHVLTLMQLQQSKEPIPIHKPVTCALHNTEIVKLYCHKCQIPLCSECVSEHKLLEHQYERLSEVDRPVRDKLRGLVEHARERIDASEEACTQAMASLSELQANHDNARSLIQETFQSYKAVLEAARDARLEELTQQHNKRELAVMEALKSLAAMRPHLEMAVAFTNALIELGDAGEVVSSERVVRERLRELLDQPLSTDIDVALEFQSDIDEFQCAVEKHFGSFKKPEAELKSLSDGGNAETVKEEPIIPSSISAAVSLLGSSITIPTGGTLSSGGASPSSLTSLQSDSDMSVLSSTMPQYNIPVHNPLTSRDTTLGMLSEYNLSNLGNLDSDPLSLAELLKSCSVSDLNTNHAIKNLQALANMSEVGNGIGEHLNGHNLNGHNNLIDQVFSTTSPPLQDLGMNGYHGLNGLNSMNGIEEYNRQMMNRQPVPLGTSLGPGVPGVMGVNCFPPPRQATSNTSSMSVRYKYGQLGNTQGQFNSPHGFCLGADEEVIVADTNNHRIQIFAKDGQFKYQFGTPGKEEGQLWYPRKVALMKKCGKYVVCDRGNERSRMQLFNKNGHFVRKISIRYIDIVAGLAVTADGLIVAVDSVSPTVFIIDESGSLVRWIECGNFMREPSDIAIHGDEFFVCDFKGHCVVVFDKDGAFKRRIGGEGLTNFPNGIDVSDEGDVLVGDSHGNRFHVTIFNRDGAHLSDVECPYVKVSRCCGLKLTREGLIVTLAKNNHHVLILSTIFIT